MEKTGVVKFRKPLLAAAVILGMFLVQELAGKVEIAVADLFSYTNIDPDNAFAWQSVHHLVMLIIGLGMVAILSLLLKNNFGFQPGDKKIGMRFFILFTAGLTILALLFHGMMLIRGQSITSGFPLNTRNVLGTLGFQLLLSGPAEEILYRALPITLLVCIFGSSTKIKWNISVEVLLASLLFSLAHVKWSLTPFSVDASVTQLLYAFAIGTVQGVAYQQSRSLLYPVLMHSVSNVLMVGTGYLFTMLI